MTYFVVAGADPKDYRRNIVPKVRLTESLLKTGLVVPPNMNRVELISDQLPNFFIEVRRTSQGQGTYYVRYRDKSGTGTTRYTKIARTTEVSLAEATAKAKTIIAEIALGADPRAEDKARKEIPTLSSYFDDEFYPAVQPKLRSAKRYRELFDLKLRKPLGWKKLDQLTRKDFSLLHTKLLADGFSMATCDHALKLGRVLLNHACRMERITRNVLAKADLYLPDNRVNNVPDAAGWTRLIDTLNKAENRPVALIMLMLLATAMRMRECLTARWEFVDKERKTLWIPPEQSKNKIGRFVILNESAMDVLNQTDTEGKYEYVFINPRTKKPYTTVWKTWNKYRNIAGLPKMRAHDARHARLSALADAGVSMVHLQAIAGHRSYASTLRYLHVSDQALHQASDTVKFAVTDRTQPLAIGGVVANVADVVTELVPLTEKPILQLVAQPNPALESQPVSEEGPAKAAA